MKIINSKLHGILDYLTVVFLLASPMLFGMQGTLATFTYVLAIIHLVLTILTAFEVGLVKIIPFRIHGVIEFIVAILLGIIAYLFYSNGSLLGYYFYASLAVVIMVVFLLTDFAGVRLQRALQDKVAR